MRDTFIQTLGDLALGDPRVALLTGDLGFGVFEEYSKQFPDQFINAGVAEQNMTALAAGMALQGWKPYTYSIGNFPTLRCLEHIRNDICYHDAPVTVVAVGGGFSYGQLGMSHFATEDIAILRALPNMRVIAPCEKWETDDLVRQLAEQPGPAYLRLDKSVGGTERIDGEKAILGKARLVRDGGDATLIATGGILSEAVHAAEALARRNIDIRILAMHTIKPLDEGAIVAAAKETGGIVSIEEHNIIGGLGSAIAETCLSHDAAPGFFHRIGLQDTFPGIVGDQNYLRTQYKMDWRAIYMAVWKKIHAGMGQSQEQSQEQEQQSENQELAS